MIASVLQSIYALYMLGNMLVSIASPRVEHAPATGSGGFSWRYLDLVDDQGDGLVLIWGWGLPFLCPPVTAPPADHPSINVAVYRGGRCIFYHLEALDPGRVSRCPGGWCFGDNVLQSRRTADAWAVDAQLDLPVAGSTARARGTIRLRGPPCTASTLERGPTPGRRSR